MHNPDTEQNASYATDSVLTVRPHEHPCVCGQCEARYQKAPHPLASVPSMGEGVVGYTPTNLPQQIFWDSPKASGSAKKSATDLWLLSCGCMANSTYAPTVCWKCGHDVKTAYNVLKPIFAAGCEHKWKVFRKYNDDPGQTECVKCWANSSDDHLGAVEK